MTGVPVLKEMDAGACRAALATADLGRLAVVIEALPAIRPVRYVLHDDRLVFRVRSLSRLRGAAGDHVVAFQADRTESPASAWTVQVHGLCEEVTCPKLRAQLESLPLPAWERRRWSTDVFLRLPLDHVSGQRVLWDGGR
jgi:uncharacterized protein